MPRPLAATSFVQMALNHLSGRPLPSPLPARSNSTEWVHRSATPTPGNHRRGRAASHRVLATTARSAQYKLGFERPASAVFTSYLRIAGFNASSCPDSIDWRTFDIVTDVKDQVN